jgi:hypothetical protein
MILGTINRAATTVQASYRQGLEINSKLNLNCAPPRTV